MRFNNNLLLEKYNFIREAKSKFPFGNVNDILKGWKHADQFLKWFHNTESVEIGFSGEKFTLQVWWNETVALDAADEDTGKIYDLKAFKSNVAMATKNVKEMYNRFLKEEGLDNLKNIKNELELNTGVTFEEIAKAPVITGYHGALLERYSVKETWLNNLFKAGKAVFSSDIKGPDGKVMYKTLFHIGTHKAALERISDISSDYTPETSDSMFVVYKVTLNITPGKLLLYPREDPTLDNKFVNKMIKQGIQALAYTNEVEDVGTVSIAILDPKCIVSISAPIEEIQPEF